MKIDRAEIENFKCFLNPVSFNCGKINLYAGINGRGKSSVLQTILLISQSICQSTPLRSILLNGEHINLGEYADVKNSNAPRSRDIRLSFDFDNGVKLPVHCTEDERSPYRMSIQNPNDVKTALESTEEKGDITHLFRNVHFVSADRLGPQMFMAKVDLPEFVHVGSRGEYCFEVLAQSKTGQLDITVNPMLYRGEDANSLLQQTIEWMSYILDGAKIDFQGSDSSSSVLSMLINNRDDSALYKPINIGFGYSYVLPLIVSGLIAKSGEILIIENPEAHLHPKAQSRIAEFYSRIAAAGVQVYIETHSEHILNGLRLSCANPEIQISPQDAEIYFFDEDFSVKRIKLKDRGRISAWPKGFFDQQECDLSKLFHISTASTR